MDKNKTRLRAGPSRAPRGDYPQIAVAKLVAHRGSALRRFSAGLSQRAMHFLRGARLASPAR
jgi:hypothetical protein